MHGCLRNIWWRWAPTGLVSCFTLGSFGSFSGMLHAYWRSLPISVLSLSSIHIPFFESFELSLFFVFFDLRVFSDRLHSENARPRVYVVVHGPAFLCHFQFFNFSFRSYAMASFSSWQRDSILHPSERMSTILPTIFPKTKVSWRTVLVCIWNGNQTIFEHKKILCSKNYYCSNKKYPTWYCVKTEKKVCKKKFA